MGATEAYTSLVGGVVGMLMTTRPATGPGEGVGLVSAARHTHAAQVAGGW